MTKAQKYLLATRTVLGSALVDFACRKKVLKELDEEHFFSKERSLYKVIKKMHREELETEIDSAKLFLLLQIEKINISLQEIEEYKENIVTVYNIDISIKNILEYVKLKRELIAIEKRLNER